MVRSSLSPPFDFLIHFPLESRRPILKNEEIEIINEGAGIKIDPEYYLNMN